MNSLGNLFFCWNISPRGMVFLFSGFQRKPQTWIAARMKHCYDQSPRLSCGPKCGHLSSPGPQRAVTSTSLWVTPLKQRLLEFAVLGRLLNNDRSWPDTPIPQPLICREHTKASEVTIALPSTGTFHRYLVQTLHVCLHTNVHMP